MHTKFPIFVVYKTNYYLIKPSLLEQKQHELEFKSWNLKTKCKQHQTRSSKILSSRFGAWKQNTTNTKQGA
jgi:hypothetical protein